MKRRRTGSIVGTPSVLLSMSILALLSVNSSCHTVPDATDDRLIHETTPLNHSLQHRLKRHVLWQGVTNAPIQEVLLAVFDEDTVLIDDSLSDKRITVPSANITGQALLHRALVGSALVVSPSGRILLATASDELDRVESNARELLRIKDSRYDEIVNGWCRAGACSINLLIEEINRLYLKESHETQEEVVLLSRLEDDDPAGILCDFSVRNMSIRDVLWAAASVTQSEIRYEQEEVHVQRGGGL